MRTVLIYNHFLINTNAVSFFIKVLLNANIAGLGFRSLLNRNLYPSLCLPGLSIIPCVMKVTTPLSFLDINIFNMLEYAADCLSKDAFNGG